MDKKRWHPHVIGEAKRQLVVLGRHVKRGDGMAVIMAVRLCAQFGLPMPDWLSSEFIKRADVVLKAYSRSWDDAFDQPWPKTHARNLEEWNRLRYRVLLKIEELRAADDPPGTGDKLFGAVAEALAEVGMKIGKTKVSDLYYDKNPFVEASDFRKKTKFRGITD